MTSETSPDAALRRYKSGCEAVADQVRWLNVNGWPAFQEATTRLAAIDETADLIRSRMAGLERQKGELEAAGLTPPPLPSERLHWMIRQNGRLHTLLEWSPPELVPAPALKGGITPASTTPEGEAA